jgi:hypothetical protein
MPRKSQDEVIADLELKLEAARNRVIEKEKTETEKDLAAIDAIDERIKTWTQKRLVIENRIASRAVKGDATSVTFASATADEV